MKRKRKGILAGLVTCCLSISLMACTMENSQFVGSSVSDGENFWMEFQIMNSSDSREIAYKAGDQISVTAEIEKGEVDLSITFGDIVVYQGNGIKNASFEVTIKEAGTYKLLVTGRKAKGKVRFDKKKEEGQ